MRILKSAQFISEKMKIMPISNDEFDRIKTDDKLLIDLSLDKMTVYDIECGDIIKSKCEKFAIVLPYCIIRKLLRIRHYTNEHKFFVFYHYDTPSPFAFIEYEKYEKTFPKCEFSSSYDIVKIFRPFYKLNFDNWSKKEFLDFFKKIKRIIGQSEKLPEWDVINKIKI